MKGAEGVGGGRRERGSGWDIHVILAASIVHSALYRRYCSPTGTGKGTIWH